MGTGKNIKHSLAIYIDADWSPLHSLPGEEGPEKARVEPQYPPTYFIKQWLVGSRSLTHISGNYTPFIFYSYHRRIKSGVVDCGKRWKEDTICGFSFPKVVSGGHQQLSPSQSQTKITSSSYAQTIKSTKSKYPPQTPPKQPTPSEVRSFSRGREKFELLKEFKKRLDQQRKSFLNQDPLDPICHLPRSPQLSDRWPLHLSDPCLLLQWPFWNNLKRDPSLRCL